MRSRPVAAPTDVSYKSAGAQATRSVTKIGGYGGLAVAAWLVAAVSTGYGLAAAETGASTSESSTSSAASPDSTTGSADSALNSASESESEAKAGISANPQQEQSAAGSAASGTITASSQVAPGVVVSSSGGAHTSSSDTGAAVGHSTETVPEPDSGNSDTNKSSHDTPPNVKKSNDGPQQPVVSAVNSSSHSEGSAKETSASASVKTASSNATSNVSASAPAVKPEPQAFETAAVTAQSVPSTPATTQTGPLSYVSSFVAALSPLLAPTPTTPAQPPLVWAVLAWVRRNFFNEAPHINYNPAQTSQVGHSVTGNIGATDPENDRLTYQIKQQPRNGALTIDQATGNFTYTPTNPNFTGPLTDSFTVSVTDRKINLLSFWRPHSDQVTIAISLLTPAHVGVDFGDAKGWLLHTEAYNNFHVSSTFAGQRPEDVAYLNQIGLHGALYRVWLNSPNQTDPICTGSSGECTLSPGFDAYLRDIENVSDAQIANLRLDAWIGQDAATARPQIERILLAIKKAHPEIQYIEAWNEPDAPGTRIQPAQVYQGYVPLYQAVNNVNATLGGAAGYVPLKVGGPALYYFNKPLLNTFLDAYMADPDPNKRLDFLSYHAYLNILPDGTRQFYKADPSLVKDYRDQLDAMLAARGLPTNLPVYITETGIYPGPLCDMCDSTDYARQAAGMPSLQYWFAQQHDTYPLNWVARRQGLKDEFVTQNSVGPYLGGDPRNPTILWQPYDPLPSDALTPYGNVLRMQSMMEDVKVSAASDQLSNGLGVYVVAAKDPLLPEASVMVWNYQGCSGVPGSTSCGSSAYHASIDMSRLPNGLADGDITVTVYRVDQNTSNYFSDPTNTDVSKANLQQVDQRSVTPINGGYTYEADLQPNAVYLVLLRKESDGA